MIGQHLASTLARHPEGTLLGMSLLRPSKATRVVRTVHQILVGAVVAFPGVVVAADLPADKAAAISGLIGVAVGTVAKVYNILWPGVEPLPEA